MVDYVKTRKNAKRLIDKNGRTVTFKKNPERLVDETKPWKGTAGSPDVFSMICLFTDYENSEIDGSIVKSSDKKLLANAIDNGSKDLKNFDFVIDGGEEWKIKKVKPLQPGPLIVMYEIQLRK